MPLNNDTRGWILTGISGIACVFGALFICVDIIVRLFPGKKNFKIQDSNGFLSCSLSLSAGVMLFSSLYKLLPESKNFLSKSTLSPKAAGWVLIACFLAGVWGIQLISRAAHFLIPSRVVDCDHTHDSDADVENGKPRSQSHSHHHDGLNEHATLETTPLLHRPDDVDDSPTAQRNSTQEFRDGRAPTPLEMGTFGKPSLQHRLTRKMTAFVSGEKTSCDEDGPCKGYSSPCGADCFQSVAARGGTRAPTRLGSLATRPTLRHAASTTYKPSIESNNAFNAEHNLGPNANPPQRKVSNTSTKSPSVPTISEPVKGPSSPADSSYASSLAPPPPGSEDPGPENAAHHHHVPQNAFLSLSFQTSVGIVLHKLPEGFITYASNHANPNLGFNVFMALAIHNVTEGFALALPIYLATNSRLRALLYSFVLGGFSQPLGAAIAAAWLHFAEMGKGDYAPSEGVYGGLFAATAGILANVALNLLSESFDLSHHKALCMFFVFVGMGILGISSALTA